MMAHKKGIEIVVQKRSAQNQVKVTNKARRKIINSRSGTYMVVDTAERVHRSRHCKKKSKLMNEAESKKHNIVDDDTDSNTDKLLHPSRSLCQLPHIARSMLVKHLKRTGVCVEISNLFNSKDYITDDGDTDNSTTSNMSDESSGCSKITENDSLLQGSEIFSHLPVVAEDMLVRHLEKEGISSKLDDQLFHRSRQVELPLAAKKILLKYLKKHNSKESYPTNKKYVMYLPYVEYWLIELSTKKKSSEDFEREVLAEFPSSFRWLITECARMLQMTVQELYCELMDVEAMHCLLLRPQVESLSEDFKKNIEKCW
jgi:hypothetical protein